MSKPRILRFFRIAEEASYGSVGATPTWTGIAPTEWTVAQTSDLQRLETATGRIAPVHIDHNIINLRGSATIPVHPETADLLLKKIPGLPRNADNTLRSYTVQTYHPGLQKYVQQTGLKCDGVRISAEAPNGELQVQYDFIGRVEEEIAAFPLPTDLPIKSAFRLGYTYIDVAGTPTSLIKFGGNEELHIRSFSIEIRNNLDDAARHDYLGRRLWLDEGVRDTTCSFVLRGHPTWALDWINLLLNRDEGQSLVFEFNYKGESVTGTPIDKITITLPNFIVSEVTPQGGMRDIENWQITGQCKTPADFSDEVQITLA